MTPEPELGARRTEDGERVTGGVEGRERSGLEARLPGGQVFRLSRRRMTTREVFRRRMTPTTPTSHASFPVYHNHRPARGKQWEANEELRPVDIDVWRPVANVSLLPAALRGAKVPRASAQPVSASVRLPSAVCRRRHLPWKSSVSSAHGAQFVPHETACQMSCVHHCSCLPNACVPFKQYDPGAWTSATRARGASLRF